MKRGERFYAIVALLALAFVASAGTEAAAKPLVRLLTHSKAGGGTDIMLREMARRLGRYMDADFVVENVSGGSGARAMARLAAAPADGSVLYGATPTYINTSLLSRPAHGYHAFTGVVNLFMDPLVVYVRAESPLTTLSEAIDLARAQPGSLIIGVTNPGSQDRQVMEMMKARAGVSAPVVSHDGGGELLINVLNGSVSFGVGEVQEIAGLLDAGRVRLLATLTEDRLAILPDTPTAREQGVDLAVTKFRGLVGPPGLSRDAIAKWEAAAARLLEDSAFRAWYTARGLEPSYLPSAAFNRFIGAFAAEQERFLREHGLLAD